MTAKMHSDHGSDVDTNQMQDETTVNQHVLTIKHGMSNHSLSGCEMFWNQYSEYSPAKKAAMNHI